jgi:hypothetical protein
LSGAPRFTAITRRDAILTAEQLAHIIVQSIDRHGLRGLIYEADGVADVVMHGKVDMLAVAHDVLSAIGEAER